MVAGWDVTLEESMKGMVPKMARSIAGKKLPPVPAGLELDEKGKPPTSIMLFYQYVEPAWTSKQHRRALSFAAVSAAVQQTHKRRIDICTLRCMNLAARMAVCPSKPMLFCKATPTHVSL